MITLDTTDMCPHMQKKLINENKFAIYQLIN